MVGLQARGFPFIPELMKGLGPWRGGGMEREETGGWRGRREETRPDERERRERADRGSDVISKVNSFTAGSSFYR